MEDNFSFDAIGTKWSIDLEKNDNSQKLLSLILKRIDEFDQNYSRFRSDSLVTKFSKQPGVFDMPADFEKMINFYSRMNQLTSGLVSPFVGNLLDQMGYDANYSFKEKEITKVLNWEDYIKYNNKKLEIITPCIMDFGAAGKGYIVDIIGDLIKENGVSNFCIDAGGDILYRGDSEFVVGLENPNNETEVIGEIKLRSKSICASSGNRRKWGKYHHIVNPKTNRSIDDILAVWVTADRTMIADGIATCLFFVDPLVLKEFNFEYLILYPDFTFNKSNGFSANLFFEK